MVRYRSTATSAHGMVASSHPLSTLAGAKILLKAGNAFDAAIATNSVLNVTQPHVCGIGGDAFFLLYDSKDGAIRFLNASGRSSRNASISYFQDRKLSSIPSRGVLSALEVPGCVDGWFEVYKRYGSIPIQTLLEDAIRLAKEGFPVSHQLSASISAASNIFSQNKEWSKIYKPQGSPPRPGELLVQSDLAWSLEKIASQGERAFYEGEIADRISSAMERHGGLIDSDDLAAHTSIWAEPVALKYRGFRIYETAPNSQGLTALIAFKLLEKLDLREMKLQSTEYTQMMIEISKIAYSYRNRYITDPEYMSIKPSEILELDSIEGDFERLGTKLRAENASIDQFGLPEKEDGDTTYYCIADQDGNCVSCIQSLYFGFGSGFVPEGTGIVMHNRGSYFSLDRKHHNALMPRKRTFHTLCASLTTTEEGEPYLLFGSMGGDIQPQIHQQVISSVLDFGTDIQQAIEDPRWARPGTIYENLDAIHFESRYPEVVVSQLKSRGYSIKYEAELSALMGHAQGIVIDPATKILSGGADPRGDGLALGI